MKTRTYAERKHNVTRPAETLAEPEEAATEARPLDAGVRARLEPEFGHSLSSIQIVSGPRAAQATHAAGARALAVGQHLLFAPGAYQPATSSGLRLLAHEAAHALQPDSQRPARQFSRPDDGSEREARAAARDVLAGERAVIGARPAAAVQRQEAGAATEEEKVAVTYDALIEQMAHVMTYADKLTTEHRELLNNYHYSDKGLIRGNKGLEMRRFMPWPSPRHPFVHPIVSFRGTEVSSVGGFLTDLTSDLGAEGIGMDQFYDQENVVTIRKTLEAAAERGPVWVTGHSLGGALAQIAATQFPDLIARVVTFQAPGINRDRVAKLAEENRKRQARGAAPIKSDHYRVAGDLVPMGGEAFTEGKISTFQKPEAEKQSLKSLLMQPLSNNPLAAHGALPLAAAAAALGPGYGLDGPHAGAGMKTGAAQTQSTAADNGGARVGEAVRKLIASEGQPTMAPAAAGKKAPAPAPTSSGAGGARSAGAGAAANGPVGGTEASAFQQAVSAGGTGADVVGMGSSLFQGADDIATMAVLGPGKAGTAGFSGLTGPLGGVTGALSLFSGAQDLTDSDAPWWQRAIGGANVFSGGMGVLGALPSTSGIFGAGGASGLAATAAGPGAAGTAGAWGTAGAALGSAGAVVGAGLAGLTIGTLLDKGVGAAGAAITGDDTNDYSISGQSADWMVKRDQQLAMVLRELNIYSRDKPLHEQTLGWWLANLF